MAKESVPSKPGARVRSSICRAINASIDGGGDAAPERLRRDVDTERAVLSALPLDRRVLEVLVGDGFDEQRIGELSALDDLRGRRRRDDRVVVRARDGLVHPLRDHDLRGDDVESLAARESQRLHLGTALQADSLLGRDPIRDGHAPQCAGSAAHPGWRLRSWDVGAHFGLASAASKKSGNAS